MTTRDVTSLFMPPRPAPDLTTRYEIEPESNGYAVVRHQIDSGQRNTIHLASDAEQARAWLAAFRRKAGEQS